MRKTTLADLKPDPKNARKHNKRNLDMLEASLRECGAGRSILIDENNVILAGNATVETAGQIGIENVRIIEASGNEIIAVRRTGLTQQQKTKLALYDNRVAELAEWDPEMLQGIDFDLKDLWNDNEFALTCGTFQLPDDPRELWSGMPDIGDKAGAFRCLHVYFLDQAAVESFAQAVDQQFSDKAKWIWFPQK